MTLIEKIERAICHRIADLAPENRPSPASLTGAALLGAVAGGALAIGAVAIGRMAIGQATIRNLRVERLSIGQVVPDDRRRRIGRS